jgi:hypothetical protein
VIGEASVLRPRRSCAHGSCFPCWSTVMVGSPRLMGADFRSLRKQEVNMAHPTPFEAIAAAIESANIDFPDAADGTTWEHIYRSTEECNHLARARGHRRAGKVGLFHRPESTGAILIASDKRSSQHHHASASRDGPHRTLRVTCLTIPGSSRQTTFRRARPRRWRRPCSRECSICRGHASSEPQWLRHRRRDPG